MKIQMYEKDAALVGAFIARWMPVENPTGVQRHLCGALMSDECEPMYLDCDAAELSNCFMELEREGFVQSVKKIFQGDHFYRSDTGKCPRCWRHRPELRWSKDNDGAEVCDRCLYAITEEVGNENLT